MSGVASERRPTLLSFRPPLLSECLLPVLSIDHLSKTFPGTRALDGVSMSVGVGQVHALVGHNGSGKSTLIKVLAGFHEPDPGSGPIRVGGAELRAGSPDASRDAGLRFIHQELGLIDGLTVLENLRLGTDEFETGFGRRIRWGREHQRAGELLERFDLRVSPQALFGDLSAIEKTGVAVARALQDESSVSVVVFDEPTARLPDEEVQRLFRLVRRVVANGTAAIYVSHRLEEVYELADQITVLRDGRAVGVGSTEELPRERLVGLIAGATSVAVESAGAVRPDVRGDDLLRLFGVSGGHVRRADLTVGAGEVVGLAGLAESGVHAVPQILLGEVALREGRVEIGGAGIEKPSPQKMKDVGVAVLPADRHLKGIPSFSLRENLTLPDVREFWRSGVFRHRVERSSARRQLDKFDVIPRDTERPLSLLSGGNQQKVCVAKWARIEPRVLVLDEPTQGVDVGGRAEILRFLRLAAKGGMAVLICSSDLDDLEEVCDRVVVFRGGVTVAELKGDEVTRDAIIHETFRGDE